MELALLNAERPPPEGRTPPAAKVVTTASPAPTVSPAQTPASAAPASQDTASVQAGGPPVAGASGAAQLAAGQAGPPHLNLTCLGDIGKISPTPDARRKCEDRKWAEAGKRDPTDSGKVPPPLIDPAKAAFYDASLKARHSPGHPPLIGCAVPIHIGEGGDVNTWIINQEKRKRDRAKGKGEGKSLVPIP